MFLVPFQEKGWKIDHHVSNSWLSFSRGSGPPLKEKQLLKRKSSIRQDLTFFPGKYMLHQVNIHSLIHASESAMLSSFLVLLASLPPCASFATSNFPASTKLRRALSNPGVALVVGAVPLHSGGLQMGPSYHDASESQSDDLGVLSGLSPDRSRLLLLCVSHNLSHV